MATTEGLPTCPKCGVELIYAWEDIDKNHHYFCLAHNHVQLRPDGVWIFEDDVIAERNRRRLNRETDISAAIRTELPKALLDKVAEVEKVIDKSITFVEQYSLYYPGAGMMSTDGKIWVAEAYRNNLGVVGEEIMHFHWRTSGLPRMSPLQPAEADGYAASARQIGGHFEEYTFFPFLRELGLSPQVAIDDVMPASAIDAKQRIDVLKANGDTIRMRVELAAKYVQAALMASDNNGEQVVKIFEDEALQPYAKIGDAICDEIRAMNPKDSADIKERMERTLYTHLALKADGVEVKPAFPSSETK